MSSTRAFKGFWALVAATALPCWSVAQPDGAREAVRGVLAHWASPGAPGVAVAVVQGGETVLVESVGLAHLEHDVPIGRGTVFHTASVSKQFTAAAVLLLEREGRLSLDDDVREHLPEVPDFGETIRLRHLLWHTSGLRDQWQVLGAAGWREDDVVTNAHVWRALSRQRELNFSPGTRETYCNTGYTLLAEVVSRVSGRSFASFCEDQIFGPLGMGSTRFHDDVHAVVPGRAESYIRGGDGRWLRYGLSFGTVGATGLLTTAEDLARWAAELQTGRVLGEDLVERMCAPGSLESGSAISYAAGLMVEERRGERTIGHAGADSGFRAVVQWFPDLELSVVMLANRPDINMWAAPMDVAEVFGLAPAPGGGDAGDDASGQGALGGDGAWAEAAEGVAGVPPEDIAGRYRSAELETVYELEVRDEVVVARHFRKDPVELRPRKEGVYSWGSWYFREIEMVRGEDGAVLGFRLHNSRARNIWFARE